jgi:hypothetical protein
MRVFLLPLGGNHHELYCEVSDGGDADVVDVPEEPGWWGRQRKRFRRMLADAEAERVREAEGRTSEKGGIGRWVVRKIAEAVAEQRLLWHLRRAPAGTLVYPDTLEGRRALESARAIFASDYRKHRRWCVIDSSIAVVTGPLFFFVPGPNLIAYYFVFRAVGHFLALRGAARALGDLVWQMHPSSHLSALDGALGLAPPERYSRLKEIEQALGLEKLAAFVQRVGRRRV